MEDQAQEQAVAAPDHGAMRAIVSGDSDCGGDATDEDDIFPPTHAKTQPNTTGNPKGDREGEPQSGDDASLYDENLDEEDEEYVYMNLRGGKHARGNTAKENTSTGSSKSQSPSVTKARNSDAVLSCPCCFNIVCMDCQRHHRYNNQFRAMFVLGITVDWQHMLKYDDKIQGLARWNPPTINNNPQAAASETPKIVAPDQNEEDTIYYAVACANCQTQVAALDMSDEVYHFYDCLAST